MDKMSKQITHEYLVEQGIDKFQIVQVRILS
jgi:hypothetical protein